jgi:FdhE protein
MLVVDERTPRFAVDVCHACSGYLKTCTALQATPSDEIIATDLQSVEFDLAAVERGYRRPPGPGVALRASVAAAEKALPSAPSRWSGGRSWG